MKYHVPTGLVFRRRRAVFILLAMPPPSLGRAALVVWCGWFKPLPQTTNQRDGSFGLYMPKAYQKNRPFGLWFMWFAWNQTCHSTNDKCEALASLKGCFLCFCFSPPVFFHWTASFACMELTIISRFQRLIKNWFGLFLRFFYGCWWSKCLIFNSIITHCVKIW